MKKIKRNYTEKQLYKAYLVEKLTTIQISEKFHTPVHLVSRDLAKLKIGRNPKEAAEVAGVKKSISKEELFNFYIRKNHTTEETAKYFNVHERTIRRRLREFGIQKSLQLQLEVSARVQKQKYGALFTQSSYYKEHIVQDMVEKVKNTCYSKYGVKWISNIDNVQDKTKETFIKKYGVPYYTQTEEYHRKSRRFYQYENEMFDSSWELALWIYANDHNEKIVRCPCGLEYYSNNKRHKYFPDFLYKNNLVEVKGDCYLNNQQILVEFNSDTISDLTKAKTECMNKNNVQIYSFEQMKPILEYIYKKYGRSYLKSFQIRKK